MENENGTYFLDLRRLWRLLRGKLRLVIVLAVLGACVGLLLSLCVIRPSYTAAVCLYVNNGSLQNDQQHLTSSDIAASRELVQTCCAILNTRTVLEEVIESGQLSCTAEELSKMIDAEAVDQTELMRLCVTSNDPYQAAHIANCIAQVLPRAVSAVIPNASLSAIDSAVADTEKTAPSVPKYTLLGAAVGILLAVGYFSLCAIGVQRQPPVNTKDGNNREEFSQ